MLLASSFASGECIDRLDPSSDWMFNQSRLPPSLSTPKSFTIDFLYKGNLLSRREIYSFNNGKINKFTSYTEDEKISIDYLQNGKDILEGKGRITKIKSSSNELTSKSMANLDSKERTNANFKKIYIKSEKDGFIFNADLLNQQSVEWRYNDQGVIVVSKEGKLLNTTVVKFDHQCRIVELYDDSDESGIRNIYKYKPTSDKNRTDYVFSQPNGDQNGFLIFNQNGLLERNSYETPEGSIEYTYTYDQYNNWTEQIYKEDGKLIVRITRALEY